MPMFLHTAGKLNSQRRCICMRWWCGGVCEERVGHLSSNNCGFLSLFPKLNEINIKSIKQACLQKYLVFSQISFNLKSKSRNIISFSFDRDNFLRFGNGLTSLHEVFFVSKFCHLTSYFFQLPNFICKKCLNKTVPTKDSFKGQRSQFRIAHNQ